MSSSTSSSSTTTSSTSTTSSTTTTSTTTTTTSTTTSSTLPPGAYQLQYNPSNKTVFIYLVVQGSSLNYNGTSNGQMRIYVPAGWNVLVKLTNPQSLPHNALIVLNNTVKPNNLNISADGKIMLYVGANATDYYGNGIYGGQSAVGVLPNIPAGYYWIACGIYSHAESGMWVVLVASNSVTVPYAIVIS
nr:sulfocyanin-like copper-binding protein [Sulfolobus acidocaldarius]